MQLNYHHFVEGRFYHRHNQDHDLRYRSIVPLERLDLVLGSMTKRFFDCRLNQVRRCCLEMLYVHTSCYQQQLENLRDHGLHQ